MKAITTTTIEPAISTRNLASLESLCVFRGETVETMGDMNNQEAAMLSASLIVRGENTKAHGVFVAAKRLSTFKDSKDVESFREAIRGELRQIGIASALEDALRITYKSDKQKADALEKVKQQAIDTANKRFDNLGQTFRAAQWMLENGKKVADSVSVFTVQQANAYLEAPSEKATNKGEKEAVRKAVLPLLAKPGTSQGAIKAAVSKAKEDYAKSNAPAEVKKTVEEVKAAHIANNYDIVKGKLVLLLNAWNALLEAGVKPETIRATLMDAKDPSKGSIRGSVLSLAQLAQLEVNASAVSVNEKGKS